MIYSLVRYHITFFYNLVNARIINRMLPIHDKSMEDLMLIRCPRNCPIQVKIFPKIKAESTVRGTDIFRKAAIVPAIKLSMDIAMEKKTTSLNDSFLFLSASASRGLQYMLMTNFIVDR